MNAKKAKALRKMLRNAEKMAPPGTEAVPTVAYYEMEKRRKYITVPDDDELITLPDGSTTPAMKQVQIAVGQLVVAPKTTRGRYKLLKKKLDKIDHKHVS